MMAKETIDFMVTVVYDQGDSELLMSLLPAEQARMNELVELGIIGHGFLSSDRSIAWWVMKGKSQEIVQEIIETLPLFPFMDVGIIPLTPYKIN